MTRVAVTGAAGPLGRRVLGALAAEPGVDGIVALDVEPVEPVPGVRAVAADVADADLTALFDGADAVVHLAADGTRRVLDAAAAVGARRVVLLSSATVYGAWPGNPVPLTEDAAVRPNPGFAYAVRKAEDERLAAEFREQHPGTAVAVLRPVPTVAEDGCETIASLLNDAPEVRSSGDADDPPAQYLHFDDLASAVAVACREGLDGPYNVAPDGWISRDAVRELGGGARRLPIPERVAARLAVLRWRLQLRPVPPALLPYLTSPWVVANDRLRAAGWTASHSNEEAFVAGHRPGPLATLSPRRRQELMLGVAGGLVLGVVAAVAVVLRRAARKAAAVAVAVTVAGPPGPGDPPPA